MGWDPGLGTERSVRNLVDYFRRWGTRANIRSISNWVQPVSVIERYRDDGEGSLFAMDTMVSGPRDGEHPAVVFGSSDPNSDVELLGWQAWYWWATIAAINITHNATAHLFTPILPYNPITTYSPPGQWVPGLITNQSFTYSTCRAFTGYNPVFMSSPMGYVFSNRTRTDVTAAGTLGLFTLADQAGSFMLERPIRLYGTLLIAWQLLNPVPTETLGLRVSILYRERTHLA